MSNAICLLIASVAVVIVLYEPAHPGAETHAPTGIERKSGCGSGLFCIGCSGAVGLVPGPWPPASIGLVVTEITNEVGPGFCDKNLVGDDCTTVDCGWSIDLYVDNNTDHDVSVCWGNGGSTKIGPYTTYDFGPPEIQVECATGNPSGGEQIVDIKVLQNGVWVVVFRWRATCSDCETGV